MWGVSILHHNSTLLSSYNVITKVYSGGALSGIIQSILTACVLCFQAVGERLGFGVRYSKAERLARRHRSNIGGFGHDRKKRASTPAVPGRRRGRPGVATSKEAVSCVCAAGGQVRVELWWQLWAACRSVGGKRKRKRKTRRRCRWWWRRRRRSSGPGAQTQAGWRRRKLGTYLYLVCLAQWRQHVFTEWKQQLC